MPNARSELAYPDVREILFKAVESPKGLRLKFPTKSAAHAFRFKCYTIRKRLCDKNKRLYPSTDPMWGRSEFDTLTLQVESKGEIKDGKYQESHYLIITNDNLQGIEVEEIT